MMSATQKLGVFCLVGVCLLATQVTGILNGQSTEVSLLPSMARLCRKVGNFQNIEHICGATLLTDEHVITASHCLERYKSNNAIKTLVVILGHGVRRDVSKVVKQTFDPVSRNNDIAILKLCHPVKFDKTIKPACLPSRNFNSDGKSGIVAGWGHKEFGGKKSNLRRASIPIQSNRECKTTTNYEPQRITENMICAGTEGSDACQGDSGGPLMINDGGQLRLIGIVSYGEGCGKSGYPGIYTRVSKYRSFICDELTADGKGDCVCSNRNNPHCHRCETTLNDGIDFVIDDIFG